MLHVALTIKCPVCGSKTELERKGRHLWMRIIPGSRRYYCDQCGSSFWSVFPIGRTRRRDRAGMV